MEDKCKICKKKENCSKAMANVYSCGFESDHECVFERFAEFKVCRICSFEYAVR